MYIHKLAISKFVIYIIKFCKNLLRFFVGDSTKLSYLIFCYICVCTKFENDKQCNPCINNDFLKIKDILSLLYG